MELNYNVKESSEKTKRDESFMHSQAAKEGKGFSVRGERAWDDFPLN